MNSEDCSTHKGAEGVLDPDNICDFFVVYGVVVGKPSSIMSHDHQSFEQGEWWSWVISSASLASDGSLVYCSIHGENS